MMMLEDNLEVHNMYNALKNAGYPTDLFLENVKTLKIEHSDSIKDNAVYKANVNTIFYDEYKPDTIYHELIHVASTDRNTSYVYKSGKRYEKSGGFQITSDDTTSIGKSVNEGYAELFRMFLTKERNLNKEEFSCKNYYLASILGKTLIDLIGEKEVSDCYFTNDVIGFYHLLRDVFNEEFSNLIGISDEIFSFNTDSLLTSFVVRNDKINLFTKLIKLSYENIENKDLNLIFNEAIEAYFYDNIKAQKTVKKKLIKEIK